MKQYYSIGDAAKAARMTRETLRHYDRIGLVKPSKKNEWTNYRYYTGQDIVRLNTVRALQLMDLPLQEIKKGESNLPAQKAGGTKKLNVSCNHGDVEIDFVNNGQ